MRWYTEVTYVKELSAGDTVSYGRTFRADKPMRVATVAVGYGDGYHRAISGKGAVLIGGKRAPILGRVCMDQLMADVTHIPGVKAGDQVVLLGEQGGERITAEELASWAGTISYEVLLAPTNRVPRCGSMKNEEKGRPAPATAQSSAGAGNHCPREFLDL